MRPSQAIGLPDRQSTLPRTILLSLVLLFVGLSAFAFESVERRSNDTASDLLESRLQAICETALPGKRVDVHDNLFEIGASSLKLIEIHESVDRDFPGLIDLTELFDYPTIAQLAKHLENKLKATLPR